MKSFPSSTRDSSVRGSRVAFTDESEVDHIRIDDDSEESGGDEMSISTQSVEFAAPSGNMYKILKNFVSRNCGTTNKPDTRKITLVDGGGSFYIESMQVDKFFAQLERCIDEKPRINEAQSDESGIMLDFDIMQTIPRRVVKEDLIEKVLKIVVVHVQKMFTIHSTSLRRSVHQDCLIAVTRKPDTRPKDGAYKDGFHILIPSLITSRAQRLALIGAIANDEAFHRLWDNIPIYWGSGCKSYQTDSKLEVYLDDINRTDAVARQDYITNELVDHNSAHVPVFFVGCPTKPGSKPYKFHQAFKCSIDNAEFEPCDIPNNLIRELSLNFASNRSTLKTREAFGTIVDNLEIRLRSSRQQETVVNQIKAISDPAADQVFNCIPLLKRPLGSNRGNFVEEYLAILANRGTEWEPMGRYLAMHFDDFDDISWSRRWAQALATRTDRGINTIFARAKKSNAEEFSKIVSMSKSRRFHEIIKGDQYRLKNLTAANILKTLNDDNLKFAILNGQPLMFQMVTDTMPEAASAVGPWKWHSMSASLMQILMGRTARANILRVYRGMIEKYASLIQSNTDQEAISSLKTTVKRLTESMQAVKDAGFLPASLRVLAEELYDPSFNERLDRHDSIIGIKDGILRLGPKYEIVKELHRYRISRSTCCQVIPYTPGDELCETILRSFRELFPKTHTDMFNYFMNMTGAALGNGSKPQKFNHLRGLSTGNGKSAWGDMAGSALGFQYSCVMPSEQLSPKNSTGSEAASPALIKQSQANLLRHDEQTPGERVMSRMVKMITGGDKFTGRALFSNVVEQFNFHCILALTSNGDLIWDNDIGIHRRVSITDFLIRFRIRSPGAPIPDDEYEAEANTDIVAKWPRDPEYTGRFAGIMAEFNSQLHRHWNGDYTKTTSKHTEAAIKAYTDQLASLRRFINSCCVRCLDAKALEAQHDSFIKNAKNILTDIDNASVNKEAKDALYDLMTEAGNHLFDVTNRASQRKTEVAAVFDNDEPLADTDSISLTAAYNAYERWHRRNREQDHLLEREQFNNELRQHPDLGRFYSKAKIGDECENVILGHLFDPELGSYSGGMKIPMRALNISRIDDSNFVSMTPDEYIQRFNCAIQTFQRFPTGLLDDESPVYNGPKEPLRDSFDRKTSKIRMPSASEYRALDSADDSSDDSEDDSID